jgi:predicted dehydrogenase
MAPALPVTTATFPLRLVSSMRGSSHAVDSPSVSGIGIGAAVVGTGFIGVVHVEALRRLGVDVTGVVGSSPARARGKAGLPEPYESFEAMLEDDRVRVVHLTTPNHLHYPQVKDVLAADKHVVCEKPLALTSAESSELLRLAEASGLVHCTNYNIRFYPLLHEARRRVLDGDLGRVWNVHGAYAQDWLHQVTDWNWRLDPELGGSLRAVADIGTHWLDLTGWIAGRRVAAVFADLYTVHPVRHVPTGPVETYADAGAVERVDRPMATEDVAHVLLRYEDGTRGQVTISQVSAGRKNHLSFELDGSEGALAWSSERHEELWLGHRDRPNEILFRDPALMHGPLRGDYPGGHAEGFTDTFKQLYRAVYAAVEEGRMPAEPDFPTFADGHEEILLGEAIARSAREERWVEVER